MGRPDTHSKLLLVKRRAVECDHHKTVWCTHVCDAHMCTILYQLHTHFVAPLNTPCSPRPVNYMRNRHSYMATSPTHNHPVIHTEEHCECTRTTVVPWTHANTQQEGKNCLGNKCTNLEAFKTFQTVCDQCNGRREGLYKVQWERQGE